MDQLSIEPHMRMCARNTMQMIYSNRLDTTKGYIRGEVALSDYYLSPLLKDFAAKTEIGDIIATRPEVYQAFVDANGGSELEIIVFEEPNLENNPRAQYTGGYPPKALE